jgi:6-phosphogluconate dehydrogenase
LVEKILDAAGQKGTGKWTVINAAEMGMPVTLMGEAVFARCLSSLKDDRERASQKLRGPKPRITRDRTKFLEDIRAALYASKIVSYAQGFMLLRTAAREYSWKLNYGNIALMWRGGCIIRSRFLGRINEAYTKHPRLRNLMLDTYFKREIRRSQKGWRNVVAVAAKRGIPLPAMSSALAFFDGYRSARLPHNLLQAQRDYFGAHTYERIDHPRGKTFHTNWTGRGGTVASGTYNA